MMTYTCQKCGETKPSKDFYPGERKYCRACRQTYMREYKRKIAKQYLVKMTCPNCGNVRYVSRSYARDARCKSVCQSCAASMAREVVVNRSRDAVKCHCGMMLPARVGYRCGDRKHEKYWSCPHQEECLNHAAKAGWDGWKVRCA